MFERASGARLNTHKSQALPIGRWPVSAVIPGITYRTHVKILGVHFWSTIRQSVHATWTPTVGNVRALAKESYSRDLCLTHRIHHVHVYLLASIWYIAQILPAPRLCLQQLTTAVSFFIWKGAIFRMPISTL
jgi:hypothetical protein